jgi:uncharacterized RDD family membrane protein YckC
VAYDNRVVTGEAVAVGLSLAGVGSRGVAALIDLVVATVATYALLFLVIAAGGGSNPDVVLTLALVVVVIGTLGYPVAMETLWRGRTLGKAAMGLRVVRDDGGPIRFRHAFVRGLVGVFVDKPGATFALAALLPMLASERHKRLGDLAAGTVVLQERVPGRIEAPVAMPPALAGWAAALDLSAIDDGLALGIRQFFGRAAELAPAARQQIEQQLVAQVVARIGEPPPYTPGWAVLAAVLAERRRRSFAGAPPPAPYPLPTMAPPPPPPASPPAPEAPPPPSGGGFVAPS